MNDGARQITTLVEIPGLPTLLVSGEPCPPERAVGIDYWTVTGLDWRAADGVLTPEQDVAVYEHTQLLEDAIVEELQARKAAAWGGAL